MRAELVELVLGEIADVNALCAIYIPRKRFELAGNKFCKRRFAIAVLAEQGDAIVLVDPQVKSLQHRVIRRVAGGGLFQPQEWTCQWL